MLYFLNDNNLVCSKQIRIAKAKIEELESNLREVPDVESLEKEREELVNRN